MADFDMNPEGDMRDPRQMLHDMKTAARADQAMTKADESAAVDYFSQGPIPTRGAEPGAPGSGKSESIPRIGAQESNLAAGVYSGAGGYEYEVMPGGEIKILKAPKDRGVGVTLKSGHPAHEAIFEELSASGASPKPKVAKPKSESDDRRSREMVGAVKPDDGTIAGDEMARQDSAMAKN